MDTSGSSRRAARVVAVGIGALGAGVVALAAVAARLSSRVGELESRQAERPRAAAAEEERKELERRLAALEQEHELLQDENRALRDALRGRETTPAPPAPRPPRIKTSPPLLEEEARKHLAAGSVEMAKGRYRDAELRFHLATVSNPGEPVSWWRLSLARLAVGNYREAAEAFARAVKLGTRDLFDLEQAPEKQFRSRADYQRFLEGLEAYVQMHPQDLDARAFLAYHQFFEKGSNYGMAAVQQILQEDPEHEGAKTLAGEMTKKP